MRFFALFRAFADSSNSTEHTAAFRFILHDKAFKRYACIQRIRGVGRSPRYRNQREWNEDPGPFIFRCRLIFGGVIFVYVSYDHSYTLRRRTRYRWCLQRRWVGVCAGSCSCRGSPATRTPRALCSLLRAHTSHR